MGILLFKLILGITLSARTEGGTDSERLTKMLRGVKATDVTERIERFSEKFIGAKYLASPLGEGPSGKYDRNPLFRTDVFDCTTYVETVVSLALSRNFSEFENKLREIRYQKGHVDFVSRNHFPCADWLPNNEKSGVLIDITEEVGAKIGLGTATAIVDKKGWYENLPATVVRRTDLAPAEVEQLHGQLKKEGARFTAQPYSVSYIPLDKIVTKKTVHPDEQTRRKGEEEELAAKRRQDRGPMSDEDRGKHETQLHDEIVGMRLQYLIRDAEVDEKFLATIPSGTILNVVKPNWKVAGTHMNVSHQGFVIQRNGATYFRHVSRSGGERLKDVLLANYLRLCLLTPYVKGFNLVKVRLAQLPQ